MIINLLSDTTTDSSRIFKCTVALGFGTLSELAFCTTPGLEPAPKSEAALRNARRAKQRAEEATAKLQAATKPTSASQPPNAIVHAAKEPIPDDNLTDVPHEISSTCYTSEHSDADSQKSYKGDGRHRDTQLDQARSAGITLIGHRYDTPPLTAVERAQSLKDRPDPPSSAPPSQPQLETKKVSDPMSIAAPGLELPSDENDADFNLLPMAIYPPPGFDPLPGFEHPSPISTPPGLEQPSTISTPPGLEQPSTISTPPGLEQPSTISPTPGFEEQPAAAVESVESPYYNSSSSKAHYKIPTSKWVDQHINKKGQQIEYEFLFKEKTDEGKKIDIYEVQRRYLKKERTQRAGILGARNSTSVTNGVSASKSESRDTWVPAGNWIKFDNLLITTEKDLDPSNPFNTGGTTPLIGKWWLKFQVKHYLEGRLNNKPQAPQYDMYFYEYTPEAHSANPQSVELEWKVTQEERQREVFKKDDKVAQLRKDRASEAEVYKAENDNGKLDVTY